MDEDELELEKQKFALEQDRFRFEQSFKKLLFPLVITFVVSISSVGVGILQLFTTFNMTKLTLDIQDKVNQNQRESQDKQAQVQYLRQQAEWKLKGVEFYLEHREKFVPKSGEVDEINDILSVLKILFPDIFEKVAAHIQAQVIERRSLPSHNSSGTPASDPVYSLLSKIPSAPSASALPVEKTHFRIFIQYKEGADAGVIDKIADALTEHGYEIAGRQRVVQSTSGEVRYYKRYQSIEANEVAKITYDVLVTSDVKNLKIGAVDISPTFPKLPDGIMELWLPAFKPS